jgi:hypothetical protein
MKSPIFPLINVLGTITEYVFLWYGGTIAAAFGKGRGDDSSQ